MTLEQVERFDTGGRFFGWMGLAACVGLALVWITQLGEPLPVSVLTGAVFFAVLFWVTILRPAVSASAETLVLRNPVSTVRIPLAAVEEIALRQVLAVRAGDRTWKCTGVGRSLKNAALGSKGGADRTAVRGGGVAKVINAADFVESRILDLAAEARDRARVERYSDEQVALGREGTVRTPAWPEVAGLAITGLAFVSSLWM